MKVAAFVSRLREAGADLRVRPDGQIACTGPASVLTAEILAAVDRLAPAIFDFLGPDTTCYACWSRSWWTAGHGHWICGICHPPAPGAVRAGIRWCVPRVKAPEVN